MLFLEKKISVALFPFVASVVNVAVKFSVKRQLSRRR